MELNERRSDKPGRRRYDGVFECPFHEGHEKQFCALWGKVDHMVSRGDFRELKKDVENKFDKSTFWRLFSIASMLIIGILGWLLVEQYSNNGKVTVLISNQEKIMKHFQLKPIEKQ